MAFGISRLLTRSSFVTCAADGEGRVGRRLVAKMPVVHGVVRRGVMDGRLPGVCRLRAINHRGQFRVMDLDRLGRLARLRISVGDDDSDMIADVAHLALGERRMRAGLHRRAVLRMDHHAADEAADLVGGDVVAGEHRDDAFRGQRLRHVDLVDRRVRVRRAQEVGVGLAVAIDVVDVVALAGDETDVFLALDGGADDQSRSCVSLPGNV